MITPPRWVQRHWLSGPKTLWDGTRWDGHQAADEGWFIAFDINRVSGHALSLCALDPDQFPRFEGRDDGMGVPNPFVELLCLTEAACGSEYHKLALEIVRRSKLEGTP